MITILLSPSALVAGLFGARGRLGERERCGLPDTLEEVTRFDDPPWIEALKTIKRFYDAVGVEKKGHGGRVRAESGTPGGPALCV